MSDEMSKKLLGEEIESITFDTKKIEVVLKNGDRFKCKPIGSMNFTAKLTYKKCKTKEGE